MSFNINMSDSTLRKIKKNVTYLESIRPVKTSQYRSTADAIIIQYATREKINIKTAENLILKLSSKRPAITNICFTNKMIKKINHEKMMVAYEANKKGSKQKVLKLKAYKYSDNSQDIFKRYASYC